MGERLQNGVRSILEATGGIAKDLNNLLYFSFENRGQIALHVHDIKLPPLEKREQLYSGLKALAQIMKREPQYDGVEFITATSWIPVEYPKVLQHLGFTVDTDLDHPLARQSVRSYKRHTYVAKKLIESEKESVGFAWIPREDFLERYGSDSSKSSL